MRNSLLLVGACLLLAACSEEPGSQDWCESKKEQPKSEWSADDAMTFARHCVIDSSTIGSEAWCDKLEQKPKSDWSASEAADYARHCVM
jgi:hypothetical protein